MDRSDAYGCRTALTCAIAKGSTLTLQVLLDNGADPNRTDDEGCTALDHLVMAKHRACGNPIVEDEIARILENAGAHPGKHAEIKSSSEGADDETCVWVSKLEADVRTMAPAFADDGTCVWLSKLEGEVVYSASDF
jgi:ankyrin repeat protein